MKRRLLGLALLLPVALVIPFMAATCRHGHATSRAGGGSCADSLLTVVFICGVPAAIAGLVMLCGRKPKASQEPPLP